MGMEYSFGEKTRILREKNGLTQTELAVLVNMTQRKISYMEHNRYEPSLSDIQTLCRYFKVSADFLLALPPHLSYPKW